MYAYARMVARWDHRGSECALTHLRRVELLVSRAWQSVVAGAWPQAAADVDAAVAIVERASDGATLPSLAAACTGFLVGLPGGLARAGRLSRLLADHAKLEQPWLQAEAGLVRAWAAIWRDDLAMAEVERSRALASLPPDGAFTLVAAELLLQGCLCAALRGDDPTADERIDALLAALESNGGLRRVWYTAGATALG